jgi:carbonic anhydrase
MKKIQITFAVLFIITLSACHSKKKQEGHLSVMQELMSGNEKYQSFNPTHPDQSKERLAEVFKGQHPKAVVVTCSDSRVSPELIFDQGVGDLFVIRTAGHAVSDYEMASIEYAVEHLKVKDVIVLGHESCGAIKAFLEHPKDSLPKHLNHLIDYFRHENEEKLPLEHHNVKEAILANVKHTVKLIQQDFEPNEVIVHGLYYNLESGKVENVK